MSKLGAALWSAGSKDKKVSFLACARVSRLDVIERMIDENPDAVRWASDIDGETALLAAADWHKYDFMDVLLKRGADVNAKYKNGDTALIAAVRKIAAKPADAGWETPLIEYLIRHDADIRITDSKGRTPAALARESSLPDLAGFIEEASERHIEESCHAGSAARVPVRKPMAFRR